MQKAMEVAGIEQILNTLPGDQAILVSERKPKTHVVQQGNKQTSTNKQGRGSQECGPRDWILLYGEAVLRVQKRRARYGGMLVEGEQRHSRQHRRKYGVIITGRRAYKYKLSEIQERCNAILRLETC